MIEIRERIIQACIDEVNYRGYKFTMDDLAKRVGISKRTLYQNFSSKEILIGETVDYIIERIDDKDNKIAKDNNLTSIEKIKQIALVIVDEIKYIDERLIYDTVKYYPNLLDKFDEWLINRGNLQRNIIKEGIAKGELKDVNYDVFIKILNSSKTLLLDRHFLRRSNLTLAEGVKSFVDIVLFGIGK